MCIFNTFKHHQKEGIFYIYIYISFIFHIFHLYIKTIKGIVTLVIKSKMLINVCVCVNVT